MVLGNLSVRQFAERVGTQFDPADLEVLESHRTNEAQFTDPAKFHIFDSPAINIYIGSVAMRETEMIWQRAHRQYPFDRPVSFYPIPERTDSAP